MLRRKTGASFLSIATLAVSLLASSCSCGTSETQTQLPRMSWDAPRDPDGADFLVNFGPVSVGTSATKRFTIENTGSTALALKGGQVVRPFSIDSRSEGVDLSDGEFSVPVGGSVEVIFGFSPSEPQAEPVTQLLTLRSNERGAPTYEIRLKGQGIKPSLRCEPSPLDFGPVVRDSKKTLTITCSNPLEVPIQLVIEGFRGNYRHAFSASAPGDDEEFIEVGADGSVDIEIEFSATTNGPNDAMLVLRDLNNQLLAQVQVVAITALSAVELDPSGCVDFGLVPVGTQASQTLLLRNIGSTAIEVLSVEVPLATSDVFSNGTALPLSLAAEAEEGTPLEVIFSPQQGGPISTTMEIFTDDERPGTRSISTCAKGIGGGPKLVCDEALVEFNMVAVGNPVSRVVRCTNDGFAPAGVDVEPLYLDELAVEGAEFRATVRNEDGTSGAKEEGYVIGESFFVDVVFDPVDEGFEEGAILLSSAAAVDGLHEIRLAGHGRDLPPCDFSILAPELRFGVVGAGETRVQTFHVINHGDSACLIHDLRLSERSDPAFSVEPIAEYELAGHGQLRVDVTFAPTANRAVITGAVQFEISNQDDRYQEVPLRGTAAQPCLVLDPEEVDFGMVGPGCTTRDRMVTIANMCSKDISVDSIEVDPSLHSGYFHVVARPGLPRVLQPNERMEFSMRYSPDALGDHAGTLSVGVTGGEPYVSVLRGVGAADAVQREQFKQRDRPKVDLLWVMDNSSSFTPYQQRVAQNVGTFLQVANEQRVDWQVAVTTTGLSPASVGPSQDQCPGGAKGGENGRFFPIDGSHPRILTPTQPNLSVHWDFNMMVGVCQGGDGVEQPLEAAYRALSPPLIDSIYDTRDWDKSGDPSWEDGNAGFIRKDAALSVIFVTDDKDHSTGWGRTPRQYADFFLSLKDARLRDMVKVHAITLPKAGQSGNCSPTNQTPRATGDRILEVVEATGGHWLNICTPTSDHTAWRNGLRVMSQAALGSYTPRFYLDGTPGDANGDGVVDEEDIQIWVDGQELPPVRNGTRIWSYDSVTHTIHFSSNAAPKPGADLSATYKVACIPD